MLSQDLEETLRRALSLAGERAHEFATLEHLLLAMTDDPDALDVLHGCKVEGSLDDQHVKGTAYFQKVCVQAPSVPWYWGVLHLDDG